jgi:DNA-binding GntR family transcriptional regulator
MNRFGFLEEVDVRRVGSVEQVAQALRSMIAEGRLVQGDRLPEVPMSQALKVSRNTLRDAIRELAAEGLVDLELHRGAMVRVLSVDDVAEIYGVRRFLELAALEAVPDASAEARVRVRDALRACREMVASQDYAGFVEHELEFHAALVAHLENSRFDRFFGQVLGELRLLYSQLSSDSEPRTNKAILSTYQRLYGAAEKGDVSRAQEMLGAHLDTYEKRLSGMVSATGQPAA